ncbi:unnamed protein product [Rotaria sordida]|uniref:MORN repeat protein n=1 Tax=Rotaria sordida TaxID=392033 RepID=A0A814R487_9BILA|nr:unnamed protein product [Rotaria sordida]CAF3729571.1 unnamed protein product [Rotaria sordida]
MDHWKTKPTIPINEMNDESLPNKKESEENKIKAVIIFSNGDRFKLTYRNDKKQDYGKYYNVNEEKFKGKDADDKPTGQGIRAYENGNHFIGTFQCGDKHGHGVLYDTNETIEAGIWVNDGPTNQDLKTISNGHFYEWKDEKRRRISISCL